MKWKPRTLKKSGQYHKLILEENPPRMKPRNILLTMAKTGQMILRGVSSPFAILMRPGPLRRTFSKNIQFQTF